MVASAGRVKLVLPNSLIFLYGPAICDVTPKAPGHMRIG
jgi:hypothetical protein